MGKFIKINDADELDSVHDLIHDCFFDVDDIVFDPPTSVLSIRFRRRVSQKKGFSWRDFISTSGDSPAIESFLRILHVESYSIKDTEKVGSYDFNVLDYNPMSRLLVVRTNIPIDIRIAVREFEISVEETDNMFESRKDNLLKRSSA